ncbi:hypothetical protein [Mesorhizobium sp. M0571]|uniref:hypothetical protein n=1 Tax=Mesorhizobium sp. M0571 TaxID=2956960 RepID=UPI003338FA40
MKIILAVLASSILKWAILVAALSVAAVVVATYFGWSNLGLSEGQARFWDVALKVVGGIAAMAGAIVTIRKFLDERREAMIRLADEQRETTRVALLEAQKPFNEKRQSVYYELVSSTSAICTRGEEDPVRIAAEQRFWELYWGPVPMVCDDTVGSAINRFEEALATKREDLKELRNSSMKLAEACRESLSFGSPH